MLTTASIKSHFFDIGFPLTQARAPVLHFRTLSAVQIYVHKEAGLLFPSLVFATFATHSSSLFQEKFRISESSDRVNHRLSRFPSRIFTVWSPDICLSRLCSHRIFHLFRGQTRQQAHYHLSAFDPDLYGPINVRVLSQAQAPLLQIHVYRIPRLLNQIHGPGNATNATHASPWALLVDVFMTDTICARVRQKLAGGRDE